MIPKLSAKIVASALALVLAGAAAAAAMASPTEDADKGSSTVEEPTGVPVPVAHDDDAPDDDQLGEDDAEDESDEVDEAEDAEDADEVDEVDDEADDSDKAGEPKDNHGAYVSAVAKDHTLTGREHGKAVSVVAGSDAGKPDHDDDADEVQADEHPGQGQGNGNGHGRP